MEPCSKAKEIEAIKRDLEGNGKPGLKEDIITIKDDMKYMNQTLCALNTSVSALLRFQVEVTTAQAVKEKIRFTSTNLVHIIVSTIIGAAAVVVAFLIG